MAFITGSQPGPHIRGLFKLLPSRVNSPKGLDQFAHIGRALPAGDERVKQRVLENHKLLLTTPHDTPADLLSFAHHFAVRFAKRRLDRAPDEFLTSSPAAVLNRGRKAGGAREEIHQDWWSWLVQTNSVPPGVEDLLEAVPSQEVTIALNEAADSAVARAAAVKLTATIPRNRVCTVPERGWKQRVVTAPTSEAAVAGTVLNRALFMGLRKEPRCALAIRGRRREAVERATRSGIAPSSVVVSTDMSTASDGLPLDLVQAIVEGLIRGWESLPDVWANALRVLTGPQALVYPCGAEVISSRGLLMGLGPTWPILSIAHLIWVDYSAHLMDARWIGYRCTAICGDDLIGFWPPRLYAAYQDAVTRSGCTFSKGKMYVHARGGNFTELTFLLKKDPVTFVPTIRWASGIPLKGLIRSVPEESGQAFESFCTDVPTGLIRARRVIRVLQPGAWRSLRVRGVSPTFPRSLGGAGLPAMTGCPTKVQGPRWLRLAIGKLLYGSNPLASPHGPPGWGLMGDPVALRAFQRASALVANGIEMGAFAIRRGGPKPDPAWRPVYRFMNRATVSQARMQIFGSASLPPARSGCRDVNRFSRSVRSWARRTLRHGVPDRMAIRAKRVSRLALLKRAKILKDLWIEPLWGFFPWS
jgi:hypothetical protein